MKTAEQKISSPYTGKDVSPLLVGAKSKLLQELFIRKEREGWGDIFETCFTMLLVEEASDERNPLRDAIFREVCERSGGADNSETELATATCVAIVAHERGEDSIARKFASKMVALGTEMRSSEGLYRQLNIHRHPFHLYIVARGNATFIDDDKIIEIVIPELKKLADNQWYGDPFRLAFGLAAAIELNGSRRQDVLAKVRREAILSLTKVDEPSLDFGEIVAVLWLLEKYRDSVLRLSTELRLNEPLTVKWESLRRRFVGDLASHQQTLGQPQSEALQSIQDDQPLPAGLFLTSVEMGLTLRVIASLIPKSLRFLDEESIQTIRLQSSRMAYFWKAILTSLLLVFSLVSIPEIPEVMVVGVNLRTLGISAGVAAFLFLSSMESFILWRGRTVPSWIDLKVELIGGVIIGIIGYLLTLGIRV